MTGNKPATSSSDATLIIDYSGQIYAEVSGLAVILSGTALIFISRPVTESAWQVEHRQPTLRECFRVAYPVAPRIGTGLCVTGPGVLGIGGLVNETPRKR